MVLTLVWVWILVLDLLDFCWLQVSVFAGFRFLGGFWTEFRLWLALCLVCGLIACCWLFDGFARWLF